MTQSTEVVSQKTNTTSSLPELMQAIDEFNAMFVHCAKTSNLAATQFLMQVLQSPIVDKRHAYRHLCALGHIFSLFGADRFAYLANFIRALHKSPEVETILTTVQTAYQYPPAPPVELPQSASELVHSLDISKDEHGWRVLWGITQSLGFLGLRKPAWSELASCLNHPFFTNACLEVLHFPNLSGPTLLDSLKAHHLWSAGEPLRILLGNMPEPPSGFVKIDFPRSLSEHNSSSADFRTDLAAIVLPDQCVDEIRICNVFEHFGRVVALSMLIKWHSWLKLGGALHIQTPDFVGSAQALLVASTWNAKMAAIRHLTGDQVDAMAFQLDYWFPERFQRTLRNFGFDEIQTSRVPCAHNPQLCHLAVKATKVKHLTCEQLGKAAESLLWESVATPNDRATYDAWCRQLRQALASCCPAIC